MRVLSASFAITIRIRNQNEWFGISQQSDEMREWLERAPDIAPRLGWLKLKGPTAYIIIGIHWIPARVVQERRRRHQGLVSGLEVGTPRFHEESDIVPVAVEYRRLEKSSRRGWYLSEDSSWSILV